MSKRPSSLKKDNTLYWVVRLYDPTDGVTLIDATGTPTVAIRKNGASTADSVTVTKRSATTGIYDCSYNPASEVDGDQYTVEESAVISAVTYTNSWEFVVSDDDVNVVQISGDATAADNLELQYDGTGLTGDTFPATQADTDAVSSQINSSQTSRKLKAF
jgi:beta-xylosidase